ncbi:hypothetical protein AAMO2058_000877300 [Amorphochlora amoebiformis]
MGITLTIINDSGSRLVGRLEGSERKIAHLDIQPGMQWTQTDGGIQRQGAYRIKVWKNNRGTKYTMQVIAPASRGEKVIMASEILGKKNKATMFKSANLNMEGQIRSAVKILKKFTNKNALDLRIPPEVIYGAKGLAFMTQSKVGLFFSISGGLGIVLVRDKEGKWTGPSAFSCGGVGAGLQMGASVTKSLLVLNNEAAVKAFSGGGQIKLGASLSVAAGPVGREAGVEARAGKGKVAACFSYAVTQGLFGGVSLDGAILTARKKENKKFYGRDVKVKAILAGQEKPPENPRLTELYQELLKLESQTGMRRDGRLHRGQVAYMVVFQQQETEDLLDMDLKFGSVTQRSDPLAHIKAPLLPEERGDIRYALDVFKDLLDPFGEDPQNVARHSRTSTMGSSSNLYDFSEGRPMTDSLANTSQLETRAPPTPPPARRVPPSLSLSSTGVSPPPPPPRRLPADPESRETESTPALFIDSKRPRPVKPKKRSPARSDERDTSGKNRPVWDMKGPDSLTLHRKGSVESDDSEAYDSKRRIKRFQPSGVLVGDQSASDIASRLTMQPSQSDSKALREIRNHAKSYGQPVNLLKSIAVCMANQMGNKSSYTGSEMLAWLGNGFFNLNHPSIIDAERAHLVLAETLLSRNDVKAQKNDTEEELATSGRVLELRLMVLFNLLLSDNYIEPKKLADLRRVQARGFEVCKSYRFTVMCGAAYGKKSRFRGKTSRSRNSAHTSPSVSPRSSPRASQQSFRSKRYSATAARLERAHSPIGSPDRARRKKGPGSQWRSRSATRAKAGGRR